MVVGTGETKICGADQDSGSTSQELMLYSLEAEALLPNGNLSFVPKSFELFG